MLCSRVASGLAASATAGAAAAVSAGVGGTCEMMISPDSPMGSPAGVVVASPVEDYFLLLDGLPEPERSAAMAVARPLLVTIGYRLSAAKWQNYLWIWQRCQ